MSSGNHDSLLVLDFDGVICDSVEECFVASWTAFHEHLLRREAVPATESARRSFRELRPFVRSGEDFVLIQQLVAAGRSPRSQAEFDREWDAGAGPPGGEGSARGAVTGGKLDHRVCKDLFYRARTDLRDRDPRAWLAMNRIYPHVPGALSRLSPKVPLFVLSTKKPPFVIAPIEAAGLPVPRERVLYSEAEPKLAVVDRLMRRTERRRAVFVEDQIDAIKDNRNPNGGDIPGDLGVRAAGVAGGARRSRPSLSRGLLEPGRRPVGEARRHGRRLGGHGRSLRSEPTVGASSPSSRTAASAPPAR